MLAWPSADLFQELGMQCEEGLWGQAEEGEPAMDAEGSRAGPVEELRVHGEFTHGPEGRKALRPLG